MRHVAHNEHEYIVPWCEYKIAADVPCLVIGANVYFQWKIHWIGLWELGIGRVSDYYVSYKSGPESRDETTSWFVYQLVIR